MEKPKEGLIRKLGNILKHFQHSGRRCGENCGQMGVIAQETKDFQHSGTRCGGSCG